MGTEPRVALGILCMRRILMDRKLYDEGCSLLARLFNPDQASTTLDDSVNGTKTKTGALSGLLARKKRIEYFRAVVFGRRCLR